MQHLQPDLRQLRQMLPNDLSPGNLYSYINLHTEKPEGPSTGTVQYETWGVEAESFPTLNQQMNVAEAA